MLRYEPASRSAATDTSFSLSWWESLEQSVIFFLEFITNYHTSSAKRKQNKPRRGQKGLSRNWKRFINWKLIRRCEIDMNIKGGPTR